MFPSLNNSLVETCDLGLCTQEIYNAGVKVCSYLSIKAPLIMIGLAILSSLISDTMQDYINKNESNKIYKIVFIINFVAKYLFLAGAIYLMIIKMGLIGVE